MAVDKIVRLGIKGKAASAYALEHSSWEPGAATESLTSLRSVAVQKPSHIKKPSARAPVSHPVPDQPSPRDKT